MKITSTSIDGAYVIKPVLFKDDRGTFIKTFHDEIFSKNGLVANFKESFYSTSKKNVIRGMHFQTPPHDHAKIVYTTKGSIVDVILDIRNGSPTFGKFFECELSATNGLIIYIPTGCAHGFLSSEEESCVVYSHSTTYMPEFDSGIHYDSFGYNWGVNDPIISNRDHQLIAFENFKSPFAYEHKE